ncbi:hypothetical protein KY289_036433 [Solanum tuberosum]|nr:hypothetical protein KY289_036433 [Solanum tuberosum]
MEKLQLFLSYFLSIFVAALLKKIKALISSHAQLAQVLRRSTNLIVSEDGMKVKCKIPLTQTDLEELQECLFSL